MDEEIPIPPKHQYVIEDLAVLNTIGLLIVQDLNKEYSNFKYNPLGIKFCCRIKDINGSAISKIQTESDEEALKNLLFAYIPISLVYENEVDKFWYFEVKYEPDATFKYKYNKIEVNNRIKQLTANIIKIRHANHEFNNSNLVEYLVKKENTKKDDRIAVVVLSAIITTFICILSWIESMIRGY